MCKLNAEASCGWNFKSSRPFPGKKYKFTSFVAEKWAPYCNQLWSRAVHGHAINTVITQYLTSARAGDLAGVKLSTFSPQLRRIQLGYSKNEANTAPRFSLFAWPFAPYPPSLFRTCAQRNVGKLFLPFPWSLAVHFISRIKSSGEPFLLYVLIWNLSYFLPKFEFSLIQSAASGASVSLSRFQRFLQNQISVLIYMIFTCYLHVLRRNIYRLFTKNIHFYIVSYPLLPKDAGCKCFLPLNLHGEVKLKIDVNFILQTLSCKLEFTKQVFYRV